MNPTVGLFGCFFWSDNTDQNSIISDITRYTDAADAGTRADVCLFTGNH